MALVILASIAVLGWLVALRLYLSRRSERLWHAGQAGAWMRDRIVQDERIAELREMVNKTRRNTGKAEM